MTFYENFIKLCVENQKKPTVVAQELGFSKAAVTTWKRGGSPTDVNLLRLADYFGVSVDRFRDNADDSPAQDEDSSLTAVSDTQGDSSPSDRDIQFALFGDYDEITDELFDDVKAYARFRHEQKLAERKARKKEQEE